MSEFFPQLPQLLQSLEDIQAHDIVVMDVRHQTAITDYMIVCCGRASRHVKAIAETVMFKMKELGLQTINHSGLDSGDWALVDFGDCVVHVMQQESRSFYGLEELWRYKTEDSKLTA